jgi:methylenetetrahydrofolate dehydrogenase (NADP+)/methenyltetrahydrofolate cyclohydrolase
MRANRIDGRAIADEILDAARLELEEWVGSGRPAPMLATVLVGNDPASETYVRHKIRDSQKIGLAALDERMPASSTSEEVLAAVERLNRDERVSAILVQLPLPEQVDPQRVIEAIDPTKDVDALHPYNVGRLASGRPTVVPCTPAGVMQMLDRSAIAIEGKEAVVVGRSNLVGRPVSMLLLGRNATVTICHSRTPDLAAACRRADILVAATGHRGLIRADMVRPGAAVIDVGISVVNGRLYGDVDPEVESVAGWLTPVPGGVGPMTRAMLISNTMLLARRQREL